MLLNESAQYERAVYTTISTIQHSGKGKNYGDNKKKGPLLPEILEGEMNGQSTKDFFVCT